MSLTSCSECGHQVSTLASVCPGCGAPLVGRELPHEPRGTEDDSPAFRSELAVGDSVQLLDEQPPPYRGGGTTLRWEREDDALLGRTGQITALDADGTFTLDIDPRGGWFAPTWIVGSQSPPDQELDFFGESDAVTTSAPASSEGPVRNGRHAGPSSSVGLVLGIIVMLLILLGVLFLRGSTVVSMEEYNRISSGMTYSEVVAIVGSDGAESSNGTVQGVPGLMPDLTTVLYVWQNANGSNMQAMFQNNSLVNKAQHGLR